MIDRDALFAKSDLIPCIIIDDADGAVLMLAYMNKESLALTIAEGRTVFWSRSRSSLWRKGESSGHTQSVVSIVADCDLDTLLIRVKQIGPACHTGERSCFFNEIYRKEDL